VSEATVEATISLGSNLGPREEHLAAARDALAQADAIELVCGSRVYQTPPVGPPGQGPYLNAVVRVRTGLGGRALLERMLSIERQRGRVRSGAERWTARTLDLDLLLYGDHRIVEPDLIVPHPRLHERSFVLVPLCDVAASERHPVLHRSFEELAAELADGETIVEYGWQFGDPLPRKGRQ
jgi:2-amino-4-hydroxy-6-hydroxymethyldihydropteridine diphosphokinase